MAQQNGRARTLHKLCGKHKKHPAGSPGRVAIAFPQSGDVSAAR